MGIDGRNQIHDESLIFQTPENQQVDRLFTGLLDDGLLPHEEAGPADGADFGPDAPSEPLFQDALTDMAVPADSPVPLTESRRDPEATLRKDQRLQQITEAFPNTATTVAFNGLLDTMSPPAP